MVTHACRINANEAFRQMPLRILSRQRTRTGHTMPLQAIMTDVHTNVMIISLGIAEAIVVKALQTIVQLDEQSLVQ